ncbi:aminopeptidase P family protein [Pelomonas aquatica]|jgi:Xaa-Pro aminopeptidase|uniref:Aminopeptidase P family protein n=1 Tax=Pelomonas aquatica TaxID=431058 RepID=A0A9X4LL59_9BURK|nr:aminopeptidase P family protein [Pelomonas aquatica]MCY4757105.1 aminopeptidase P family protein [Pelomonas aquatica]MDG0864542.1 aminopeptidase P family protein [Pelomonas aquatica]
MDTRTSETRLRIERVRDALIAQGLHAVLVPSSDPHLSEYLPGRWQGREWLSGFNGSVGSLVVTRDRAALFADSRYWAQAEAQIAGSGIQLEKMNSGASTLYIDWIAKTLQPGQALAVDGQVLGLALANTLRAAMQRAGVTLRSDVDLLQAAWDDRPGLPADAIYEHQLPQAVVSRADKLARVRQAMASVGATHHLVSTVDDVAWLLNLRGSDVECNPVFIAHLLLDAQGGRLFVGDGKVPADAAARLSADGIQLAPYGQAAATLAALPAGARLLIDPRRVTLGLREAVPAAVSVVEQINPSTLLKSRKTAAEAEFVRETMARDGAAMCEFYAEFEAALARGERWSELDIDTRLTAARRRRPGFVGPSFSTIAGWMANGALPHYRATPESFAQIEGDGLLLLDSGGQYLGGTTDITRVWPIGSVSAAQKRDYTLVLKGTIALSRTRFPRGTLSPMLDAIARAPLWEHGLDYGHGTGHGVGYFMNVHEGPQSISKAVAEPAMAMEPGMITSIEPGLYRPGQWGVRIENLVLNVAIDTPEKNAFGEMLEFETLTLCPIATSCIDASLLRADEIAWLNDYHATVRARLQPLVSGPALAWLLARTEPLAA